MKTRALAGIVAAIWVCGCIWFPGNPTSYRDLSPGEQLVLMSKGARADQHWSWSSAPSSSYVERYVDAHKATMNALDVWHLVEHGGRRVRRSDVYRGERRHVELAFSIIPEGRLRLAKFREEHWDEWSEEEKSTILQMDRDRAAKMRKVGYKMTPEEEKLADEYELIVGEKLKRKSEAPEATPEVPE